MSMPGSLVDKDCCLFYTDFNFNGESEAVCSFSGDSDTHDVVTGKKYWYSKRTGAFKSHRCGSHTWLDMCDSSGGCGANARNYISTGGRVDNPSLYRPVAGSVTVGYYDPNTVPAATIFAEADCSGGSLRLYSSPDKYMRSVEYAQNRVGIVH